LPALQHAESRGVVFAWDAEQIYLQPAIDLLLLDLMRKYSRQHAAIFHTYQCYLKVLLNRHGYQPLQNSILNCVSFSLHVDITVLFT